MNRAKYPVKVDDISLHFGGVSALTEVSLELRPGELLAIIGPNGAGKTCLVNCISGFYRPQKGNIYFGDHRLTRLHPNQIAKLGIARIFQNIRLFKGLSTLDNLLAARYSFYRTGLLSPILYLGPYLDEEVKHRMAVEEIIDFLEIKAIRKQAVGTLPQGLRKRVELGRALALEPTVLLLDEPFAGMNVEEKEDMARFILDISEDRGTTIVLIEHDMGVVMDIAQRVIVLEFGHLVAEGKPDEIKNDPQVVKAYLGTKAVPGLSKANV